MQVVISQRKVWQEKVDCAQQLDDVNVRITIALTPHIVHQVPQAVVSLFWCHLWQTVQQLQQMRTSLLDCEQS